MMTNMLEKLMALLDGELVASEGAAVIREAAREDSLAGMLEICAATARSRVGRPFTVIAATPAPAYMVDMIMRAPITTPAIERARQPSHSRTLLSRLKKRYQVPGWTLAAPAMAALLVAAGVGWLLLPTLDQGLRMEANLGAALEAAGSSRTLALLKPVLTFKNNDGAWAGSSVRYGPQICCPAPHRHRQLAGGGGDAAGTFTGWQELPPGVYEQRAQSDRRSRDLDAKRRAGSRPGGRRTDQEWMAFAAWVNGTLQPAVRCQEGSKRRNLADTTRLRRHGQDTHKTRHAQDRPTHRKTQTLST
jgi:hypothetical protein